MSTIFWYTFCIQCWSFSFVFKQQEYPTRCKRFFHTQKHTSLEPCVKLSSKQRIYFFKFPPYFSVFISKKWTLARFFYAWIFFKSNFWKKFKLYFVKVYQFELILYELSWIWWSSCYFLRKNFLRIWNF